MAKNPDLNRQPSPSPLWTEQEVDVLRQLYPTHTADQLLPELPGKTARAIRRKAWEMGLKKLVYAKNIRPIGSERMDGERGLIRKVANTGHPSRDWKRVEVIEWEAENGPVPQGHLLILTRRDMPRTAANLRLVRRVDMPMFAIHTNASPEERELIKLKAQFGFRLARIERQNGTSKVASEVARAGNLWSEDEVKFLLASYSSVPPGAIAARLKRTRKAVLHQLQKRGLRTPGPRPDTVLQVWAEEEKQRLRALYSCHGASELASAFGRTPHAIYHMATRLGLQKKGKACRA